MRTERDRIEKHREASLKRELDAVIKKHSSELERITDRRRVAVLIHDPGPDCREAARILGWDGRSAVLTLASSQARRLAASMRSYGDSVTPRWLASGQKGRVFVVVHDGTLLLNCDFEAGTIAIEPGSLDSQWMN